MRFPSSALVHQPFDHAVLSTHDKTGTWQSKPEEVSAAVAFALKESGSKHIDCAFGCAFTRGIHYVYLKLPTGRYGNEKYVGAGIAASGVPRSEIFVRLFKIPLKSPGKSF
jgi:phosphopantetheinyl transferase (holo-ACP synthase)